MMLFEGRVCGPSISEVSIRTVGTNVHFYSQMLRYIPELQIPRKPKLFYENLQILSGLWWFLCLKSPMTFKFFMAVLVSVDLTICFLCGFMFKPNLKMET